MLVLFSWSSELKLKMSVRWLLTFNNGERILSTIFGAQLWLRPVNVKYQNLQTSIMGLGGLVGVPQISENWDLHGELKKKKKSDSFPCKYLLIHSLVVGFCSWPLNWADKNKSDTTITMAPTTSSTAGCQQPFPASFWYTATVQCISQLMTSLLKKKKTTSLLGKNLNIHKGVKNSLMSPMYPSLNYGSHQFMATRFYPRPHSLLTLLFWRKSQIILSINTLA